MYAIEKTFLDYDGNERKETFRFNLNEKEFTMLNVSKPGGFIQYVEGIIAAQDAKELMDIFEELIDLTYGVKTPDGRGFMKSPEILANFKATEAYSDIFMELAYDDKKASAFVNNLLSEKIRKEIAEAEADTSKPVLEVVNNDN